MLFMLHKKLFTVIFCFFFFVMSSAALAAPPLISKINYSEDTIIITGSAFGVHPDNNEGNFTWKGTTPICAKFKDFEDNLIESQGFHVENGYDTEWHIGTTLTRPNSSYHGVREYISKQLSMLRYSQSAKSKGTLFASFYKKVATDSSSGKPWRVYFGDNSSRDNMYMASTDSGSFSTHSEGSSTGGDYFFTPTVNTWYRYDIIAEYQRDNTGTFKIFVNGVLKGEESDYFNYVVFDPAGHGVQWGYINSDAKGTWDYDDIYVDYTQARVEIGNASTWEACTHREIQIPTVWKADGTSIQIIANQGSFNEGDTAYLFVVDADGNVNTNGYHIVIGGGSGDSFPSVNISSPTSATTYATSQDTIAISGNASDDVGISTITWSNNRGGNGPANNDSGDWRSWSIENIVLHEGDNVITVTATDSADQTSSDTITVTSSDIVQVWSATAQTGDSVFKDSVVTYCVRLLIEGDQVTQSGSTVRLGFQGRSSGDYTIKKVSVAERDTGGAEGDVIDSTWTRVTFDGNSEATWASDVMTVSAGTEKLSDPISFSLQAGKDYYITFKIDTPSLYLNPPAFYRELYFSSADHTDDIDWSDNGHSITQDYHALSKIYIISGEITSVPSAPSGLTVVIGQ